MLNLTLFSVQQNPSPRAFIYNCAIIDPFVERCPNSSSPFRPISLQIYNESSLWSTLLQSSFIEMPSRAHELGQINHPLITIIN